MIKEKYLKFFQTWWNRFPSLVLVKNLSLEVVAHKVRQNNYSENLPKSD